ncbi:uncharacterized protein LOC117315785 [Pecten maximus]|uniref:uncharacterized protein LOC117315785 n=1 Tax=Pecten maximus TaxID=6579 RepID=UPI001458F870|nr:uncharacterized protein LOC117315785 [Pecten maximus]
MLTEDFASKHQMELYADTSVYLYGHDLAEIQKISDPTKIGTSSHGCRMAKLQMNKFWSKSELQGLAYQLMATQPSKSSTKESRMPSKHIVLPRLWQQQEK